MPLDRKITITRKLFNNTIDDETGETEEVVISTHRVYATVMPKSQLQTAEEGGQLTARNRSYRIRFISALETVRPTELFIDAGEITQVRVGMFEPIIYKATNLYEDTGRNGEVRRRWMVLECTYTR